MSLAIQLVPQLSKVDAFTWFTRVWLMVRWFKVDLILSFRFTEFLLSKVVVKLSFRILEFGYWLPIV